MFNSPNFDQFSLEGGKDKEKREATKRKLGVAAYETVARELRDKIEAKDREIAELERRIEEAKAQLKALRADHSSSEGESGGPGVSDAPGVPEKDLETDDGRVPGASGKDLESDDGRAPGFPTIRERNESGAEKKEWLNKLKEVLGKHNRKLKVVLTTALVASAIFLSACNYMTNRSNKREQEEQKTQTEESVQEDSTTESTENAVKEDQGESQETSGATQEGRIDRRRNAAIRTEKGPHAGELSNGVQYDYSLYMDYENKGNKVAFGPDMSDAFGDPQTTVEYFMEVAKGPEFLANFCYNILDDNAKSIAGISESSIDDMIRMMQGKNGGKVQQRLTEALESFLTDDTISFKYETVNGAQYSDYAYFNDKNGDGKAQPGEFSFDRSERMRKGALQFWIIKQVYNQEKGTYEDVEIGLFNLHCGLQPCTNIVAQKQVKKQKSGGGGAKVEENNDGGGNGGNDEGEPPVVVGGEVETREEPPEGTNENEGLPPEREQVSNEQSKAGESVPEILPTGEEDSRLRGKGSDGFWQRGKGSEVDHSIDGHWFWGKGSFENWLWGKGSDTDENEKPETPPRGDNRPSKNPDGPNEPSNPDTPSENPDGPNGPSNPDTPSENPDGPDQPITPDNPGEDPNGGEDQQDEEKPAPKTDKDVTNGAERTDLGETEQDKNEDGTPRNDVEGVGTEETDRRPGGEVREGNTDFVKDIAVEDEAGKPVVDEQGRTYIQDNENGTPKSEEEVKESIEDGTQTVYDEEGSGRRDKNINENDGKSDIERQLEQEGRSITRPPEGGSQNEQPSETGAPGGGSDSESAGGTENQDTQAPGAKTPEQVPSGVTSENVERSQDQLADIFNRMQQGGGQEQ